jgi:HKD family nuclease
MMNRYKFNLNMFWLRDKSIEDSFNLQTLQKQFTAKAKKVKACSMKFIRRQKDAEGQIMRMLRTCTRLRWAVAWASHDFPLFKLLQENRAKIQQATVGIHFYQTHPDFIASFMEHDAVRFVMNPSGVFHPKLYYFEYENGDWECITGSPNFTRGAFSHNTEVAVLFGNHDAEAVAAHDEIMTALDDFNGLSKRLSEKDLLAYRTIWKRQQRRLNPLSGSYSSPESEPKSNRSPLETPLFVADWSEYFNSVREDTQHTTEGRLAVLEEAHRLFENYPHFSDMSDEERKSIAGFGRSKQLDWLWFGSMRAAGLFKQAINENNHQVSEALDEIPLSGEVTQEHFDRYLYLFRNAFENSGIATATRLLAMKRPDYFVCLDSKNRDSLCEEFKIPKNIALDGYWAKVVERITDSNWWNSPEPQDAFEKRIWKCRAAFLDVRFYKPE